MTVPAEVVLSLVMLLRPSQRLIQVPCLKCLIGTGWVGLESVITKLTHSSSTAALCDIQDPAQILLAEV